MCASYALRGISEVELELAQDQAQTSTAQPAGTDRGAASEGAPDASSRLSGVLGRISELETAADELRRSTGLEPEPISFKVNHILSSAC